MKRFWDRADYAEVPGGFAIMLDGKPLRLPGVDGRAAGFVLPGRPLAEAVAGEWQQAGGGKGGEMSLDEVPLTRLTATGLDRIAPDPGPTVEAIARYAETDLLCYRAEDRRLAALEAAEWDPVLDWCATCHGARLHPTSGIGYRMQDPDALERLRDAVAAHSPLELSALGLAVPALGSLVLGLALSAGALDPVAAYRLSIVDETYQEAFWGEDAEALARRERLAADVALSARLLFLARTH
ncbi:ATP12 family chaperone protein [Roseomonas gilardii]|uniref:ATP12 family chaperone protein n=1 Tax=Roseomonas gilardii TaxID=257708 RepID=UPI00119E9059|nr:ATP12 family protein [Roseomonas gilardii]